MTSFQKLSKWVTGPERITLLLPLVNVFEDSLTSIVQLKAPLARLGSGRLGAVVHDGWHYLKFWRSHWEGDFSLWPRRGKVEGKGKIWEMVSEWLGRWGLELSTNDKPGTTWPGMICLKQAANKPSRDYLEVEVGIGWNKWNNQKRRYEDWGMCFNVWGTSKRRKEKNEGKVHPMHGGLKTQQNVLFIS